MLAQSVWRGRRRKLLAATAVALGVASSVGLLEVLLASGDRLAAELGSYGANLRVLPTAPGGTFDAAELAAVREIFWSNNVEALAPTLDLRPRMGGPGGDRVATLTGTWFDVAFADGWRTGLPAVRPTLEIAGRWPRDGAEEAAVGRRLAAELGLGPGDRLRAELAGRARELAVVGVVGSGGDEEDRVFAPLAAVETLAGRPAAAARSGPAAGLPAGPVTGAEVFALTNPEIGNRRDPDTMTPDEYDLWYCTAYPSSVAHQIGEAMPNARAEMVVGITAATRDLLERLRAVLMAVAAVALAAAMLGVAAVMTATVLERRLEAGLLLALGAEGWKVALFFLAESALLGLGGGIAGGAVGLLAGSALGRAVFGVAVPVSPVLLPVAAAAGVAIAVVGGVSPVVRLFRERPALALRRATA